MMLGSGDPTPLDFYAMVAICTMAVTLLFGCVLGPSWITNSAALVRWGATILALVVFISVQFVTPTMSGAVGAGRLITLWPAAFSVVVLFLVWSWRIGHF